jgi:homopolymeric O-antigen transport system ATP-binding protein
VSEAVLDIQDVWKQFDRRGAGAPQVTRWLGRRQRDVFWALRGLSFTVAPGEMFGIVGANGSGKSTLLRLIGGVGRPTRGRIASRREVGAVLTLGDAFDPLLTGRENALTAALVAGFTRREAAAMLDEISEFAELEDAFDYPLRTYSDGMGVRLAFSVAMSIDPEILILDEVLAVGDARFQARCYDRLETLRADGRTVLLTSHDAAQLERLCDRALWLAHGEIAGRGTPSDVLDAYKNAMRLETERRAHALPGTEAEGAAESRFGTQEIEITDVAVLGSPDAADSAVGLRITLLPHTPVYEPIVGVSLHRVVDGMKVLDVSTLGDRTTLGRVGVPTTLELWFDRLDIEAGHYRFDVGVYERGWSAVYDYHWQAYPLEVLPQSSGFGPPRRWRVV